MHYTAATVNFRVNFKDNIFKDLCPGSCLHGKWMLLSLSVEPCLQGRGVPAQFEVWFSSQFKADGKYLSVLLGHLIVNELKLIRKLSAELK